MSQVQNQSLDLLSCRGPCDTTVARLPLTALDLHQKHQLAKCVVWSSVQCRNLGENHHKKRRKMGNKSSAGNMKDRSECWKTKVRKKWISSYHIGSDSNLSISCFHASSPSLSCHTKHQLIHFSRLQKLTYKLQYSGSKKIFWLTELKSDERRDKTVKTQVERENLWREKKRNSWEFGFCERFKELSASVSDPKFLHLPSAMIK